jgi:hypothetical protein
MEMTIDPELDFPENITRQMPTIIIFMTRTSGAD